MEYALTFRRVSSLTLWVWTDRILRSIDQCRMPQPAMTAQSQSVLGLGQPSSQCQICWCWSHKQLNRRSSWILLRLYWKDSSATGAEMGRCFLRSVSQSLWRAKGALHSDSDCDNRCFLGMIKTELTIFSQSAVSLADADKGSFFIKH